MALRYNAIIIASFPSLTVHGNTDVRLTLSNHKSQVPDVIRHSWAPQTPTLRWVDALPLQARLMVKNNVSGSLTGVRVTSSLTSSLGRLCVACLTG